MTHKVAQDSPAHRADEVSPISRMLSVDRAILVASTFLPLYLAAATLLAVGGWYRPATVALGAVVPAAVLSWLVARKHTATVLRLPPLAPTAATLGVIAVVAAANVVFAGEHLLTDRDPGVYLNTAQWLAVHGNLLVEGVTGPFEGVSGLTANWTGFYEGRPDGLLYPQFLHMFPSGIAGLKWVFGDVALRMVNAPLMALGLSLVYVLTAQVTKPWFASIAIAASSVSVVSWYFARDAYTEPLMLLLLALAIASVWIGYTSRTMMPVFVAGLAIGATAGVRIDSWLLLSGFVAAVALLYVGRVADETQDADSVMIAMVASYAVGLFSFVEGGLRSPGYLSDRLPQIRPVLALAALALAFSIAVVISARLRGFTAARIWVGTVYRRFRWGLIAMVVFVASYLAFIRPLSQATRSRSAPFLAEILEKEGLPADGLRTMTELTMRWFAWYWGWIGLVLVVVGLLIVILRAGSSRTVTDVALMFAGAMVLVYLVRPSIFGDQPWAMRRFLAPALLLIPLLTATSIDAIWSLGTRARRRWRTVMRAAAISVGLAIVLVPLSVSLPIWDVSHQQGMVRTTEKLCSSLPVNAAVVVSGAPLDAQFGATIRTFCDVPTVASVEDLDAPSMSDIAVVLSERGMEPIFVTATPLVPDGWRILASDITQYSLVQATAGQAPDSVEFVDFRWYASTLVRESS